MENFILKRLWLDRDKKVRQDWEWLMDQANLGKTEQVDYTVAIYHHSGDIAATGSLDRNILKCLVVCKKYQSENLLTHLVMALLDELRERLYTNSFVYTKPKNIIFFKSLGYRVIAETENLAFLEQGIPSFSDYLKLLKEHFVEGSSNSAIVMNANPFTLGHQYLVETAASQSSHLYVFVVSEDRSFFNTNDRMEMVKRGVSHLPNVTVLPTRDYMVSSATFPSYFLKEKADLEVAKVQATLDATLFLENIVPTLQLTKRFVGQEPLSPVTSVYNDALRDAFGSDLELVIIDRLSVREEVVSATRVRAAIQDKNVDELKQLVPATTYHYLEEKHFIG